MTIFALGHTKNKVYGEKLSLYMIALWYDDLVIMADFLVPEIRQTVILLFDYPLF